MFLEECDASGNRVIVHGLTDVLGNAMAPFGVTKLTKVEIMGEPEITREGANAAVHVDVQLFEVTGTLEIAQADLAKVVKTVAFLEKDADHGDTKHGDRSTGNRKSSTSGSRSHDQPSRKSGE